MRIAQVFLVFVLIAVILSAAYLGGGLLSGRSGIQDMVPILTRVSVTELLGLAFGAAVILGVRGRPGVASYLRGLSPTLASQMAILAAVALLCGGVATIGGFSYLAAFVPGAFLAIQSNIKRNGA